jgi:hypothetical protein
LSLKACLFELNIHTLFSNQAMFFINVGVWGGEMEEVGLERTGCYFKVLVVG